MEDKLVPIEPEDWSKTSSSPYVAILSEQEWRDHKEMFEMGLEWDVNAMDIHNTKAEVNYDSLTGTFFIPDRENMTHNSHQFAFALDEKGIVLVDESGKAEEMVQTIRMSKRWKKPCLERFLYDFLEQIISKDLVMMEYDELELDQIENQILTEKDQVDLSRINEIRGEIRELRVHYEQLIDMTQELEENENGFFDEDNLRYLHLFMNRMGRLHDMAASLWEHTIQVRDLYHTQLEVRQNRIMTLLTVVTTIFMPLTLIVGWYGMNFRYMPELDKTWGYPLVIVVSIVIVIVSLIFFKKKKWL
ncbi:MAG: magnesium transporter CorA [Firmicutes bacterium]|nr:magnesium transporter CorA [Bacillota bacterium]